MAYIPARPLSLACALVLPLLFGRGASESCTYMLVLPLFLWQNSLCRSRSQLAMEGGERLLPIEALQVGQQVPALETVSNLDLIFFSNVLIFLSGWDLPERDLQCVKAWVPSPSQHSASPCVFALDADLSCLGPHSRCSIEGENKQNQHKHGKAALRPSHWGAAVDVQHLGQWIGSFHHQSTTSGDIPAHPFTIVYQRASFPPLSQASRYFRNGKALVEKATRAPSSWGQTRLGSGQPVIPPCGTPGMRLLSSLPLLGTLWGFHSLPVCQPSSYLKSLSISYE